MIKLYHSYCKQPIYGEKIKWSSDHKESGLKDYLEISQRLEKLLERRKSDLENDQPAFSEAAFDEIEIDPGYEISLEDINKLPDFSYDE